MPMKRLLVLAYMPVAVFVSAAWAQAARVVDIPTRPGVTQRILLLGPENPKAAVILLPGGHDGLQISPEGRFKWGEGNFVVRTREMFAAQGLLVAVADAPSDRQSLPYLKRGSGAQGNFVHCGDPRPLPKVHSPRTRDATPTCAV